MRKTLVAALAVVAALLSAPARTQVQFTLIRCELATSVTGRTFYVGTYNTHVSRQVIKRTFTEWCPNVIQVY